MNVTLPFQGSKRIGWFPDCKETKRNSENSKKFIITRFTKIGHNFGTRRALEMYFTPKKLTREALISAI